MTKITVGALLFLEGAVAFCQRGSNSTVSHIERSVMDVQADPCRDFYRYACGNYAAQYPLKTNQDYVFLPDIQRKDPVAELASYLSVHDGRDTGDVRLQALHDYYTACTEANHHGSEGLRTLQPLLAAITRYRNASDLPSLLVKLSSAGSMPFFRIVVGFEPDIQPTRLVEILSPLLSLPSSRMYRDSTKESTTSRTLFREHIRRVFEALGDSRKHAKFEADSVLTVERLLAAGDRIPVENRDPDAHIHAYTPKALHAEFRVFDWLTFFSALGVAPEASLNVDNPRELGQFALVLRTLPSSTLRAYLRYRFVASIPSVIAPPRIAAEAARYARVHPDGNPSRPQSSSCLLLTARARQDDVTRLYVHTLLPENLKSDAEAIVDAIKKQLAAEISSAAWLNPQTREKGLRKLTELSEVVAYDRLPHHYEAVDVDRRYAVQNYLQAMQHRFHEALRELDSPMELGLSQFLPIASGARYDGEVNTIEIPAADWTPPSFDPEADLAENYGRIGFTVGHELIHAFDDKGRQRDGSGRLSNWWTNDDAAEFRDRAECFVHEYQQFGTDQTHHENGLLTLGENIADNGGLHIALLAFLAKAQALGEDVDRVQEGWTPLQRFFLSYAQETCSAVRPESERIQLQTNPHTLDRFRADGVVQNLPEFGRAFSCREGQPMAPRKRCSIW